MALSDRKVSPSVNTTQIKFILDNSKTAPAAKEAYEKVILDELKKQNKSVEAANKLANISLEYVHARNDLLKELQNIKNKIFTQAVVDRFNIAYDKAKSAIDRMEKIFPEITTKSEIDKCGKLFEKDKAEFVKMTKQKTDIDSRKHLIKGLVANGVVGNRNMPAPALSAPPPTQALSPQN